MLTLDVEYDYDFLTLGISSREPAYRVCWFLNKTLGINLKREEENHLIFDHDIENHHVIYFYFSKEELVEYALIKNKSESCEEEDSSMLSLFETKNTRGYLIPEQPKIDYYLRVTDLTETNELISKTREIPYFNAVFDIDVHRLKSKENLIFE